MKFVPPKVLTKVLASVGGARSRDASTVEPLERVTEKALPFEVQQIEFV